MLYLTINVLNKKIVLFFGKFLKETNLFIRQVKSLLVLSDCHFESKLLLVIFSILHEVHFSVRALGDFLYNLKYFVSNCHFFVNHKNYKYNNH